MAVMDRIHLDRPYAGSRMMRDLGLYRRWSTQGDQLDAQDGHSSRLPQAQYQHETPWAQDLSVFVANTAHCSTQSDLGAGHHVLADETRISVSARSHRLVQQKGAQLEIVEHHACGFLR